MVGFGLESDCEKNNNNSKLNFRLKKFAKSEILLHLYLAQINKLYNSYG